MKNLIFIILLPAFVLIDAGAMAQAFGWSKLGGDTNTLKSTGRISSLCPDAGGEVYARVFLVQDSGNFYVARFNGIRWENVGNRLFHGTSLNYPSNSLTTDGFGTIYVAYDNSEPGTGTQDHIDKYLLGLWETLPQLPGTNQTYQTNYWVFTLSVDDIGNLYAGGWINDTIGNSCIIKRDLFDKWIYLPIDPMNFTGGWINTICTDFVNVYAAGVANINNDSLQQVIKLDGTNWSQLGVLNANGSINSLCAGNLGHVYAAGAFTNASGHYYVAEWDNGWSEVGGDEGIHADGAIRSTCTDGFGNLYAAGGFKNSRGYFYVAKWDGLRWSELGDDSINPLNANGEIFSVCIDATGNVYAAGAFTDSAGYYYVAKCAKIDQVKWIPLKSNTPFKLNSVYFPPSWNGDAAVRSRTTGYVAGAVGTILKTINGGTDWTPLTSGTSNSLNSICFPGTNDGYAVGEGGTILKTINGGMNWAAKTSGTNNQLNSVCFTDTLTGYAVGTDGIILKTSNGGTNWIALNSGISDSIYSVYFANSTIGYAVGASGKILKTQDAGTNWLGQVSGTINSLHSVRFINDTTGFAVGDSGTILKTSDGGATWIAHKVPVSFFLNSVYFTDADTGYASGANGAILKTTNGGTIWAVQNSGISNNLYSIFFTAPFAGYAVGDSGTIIRTVLNSPLGINNKPALKPDLLKIFPNPSHGLVTIRTSESLPQGELSLLNLNGQELSHQTVTGASATVDLASLPAGVYVVKLTAMNVIRIGKVIREP